jgi:hypothetical protein
MNHRAAEATRDQGGVCAPTADVEREQNTKAANRCWFGQPFVN